MGLAVAAVLGVLLVAGAAAALTIGRVPAASYEPPRAGAGSTTVVLGPDATSHPNGDAVRRQLQRHYDAINGRDYAAWQDTVVPERSAALAEPAWQDAYASTRDGTVRVYRISEGPGDTLLVRLRFVSTQAVADAPADVAAERICWRSTLPMTGTPPRIATTGGGSSTAEVC